MGKDELSGDVLPETVSEELWVLQGRVKALEGYLRWAASADSLYKSVSIDSICQIMGFDIPETKGE